MPLTDKLTAKAGPLPVWGWGAVIVGGYIGYRFLAGRGGNGATAAGVPSSGAVGDPSGGGGGGGGGATDALQTAVDRLTAALAAIPAAVSSGGGSGSSGGSGGSSGSGSGAGAGSTPSLNMTPTSSGASLDIANLQIPTSVPGAATLQAAYDKVLQYSGNITSVGPSYDSYGQPIAGSEGVGSNLSLVDWYKYQFAKLAAARQGVIIGESFAYLAHSPDPVAYIRDVLANGQFYMYGANDPRDIAARAQALAELPGTNLSNSFPGSGSFTPAPDMTPSGSGAVSGGVVNYASDISKLRQYIANLSGIPHPTAAQTSELQTYQARLADYLQRQVTGGTSGTPPAITNAPTGMPAVVTPAPSTTASPVDYSKAISTLNGYIANLSAVPNPTTAQRQELATYQQRLATYAAR